MDRLEEHIRKYREELDMLKPPSGIWKRVSRELGHKKVHTVRWLSAAAIVTVIMGTAFLFRSQIAGIQFRQGERGNSNMPLSSRTQLQETEIYYNNLANSLYREARPLMAKYPEIEKELLTDISQIDSICMDIKNDLKDNVANQDVIEALIRNYRIKITLLEDMLSTLRENEDNAVKRDGHEL